MGDARQPEPIPAEGIEPTPTGKAPWISPTVTELPRLTDLTLQTGGIRGGGDTGGGGSTVF